MPVSKMEETVEAHYQVSLKTAKDSDGGSTGDSAGERRGGEAKFVGDVRGGSWIEGTRECHRSCTEASREREDCVGVPRSALAECTAGDHVTTEQQRDRGRVLRFTVHSATHLALSTSHHNNNNHKELAL